MSYPLNERLATWRILHVIVINSEGTAQGFSDNTMSENELIMYRRLIDFFPRDVWHYSEGRVLIKQRTTMLTTPVAVSGGFHYASTADIMAGIDAQNIDRMKFDCIHVWCSQAAFPTGAVSGVSLGGGLRGNGAYLQLFHNPALAPGFGDTANERIGAMHEWLHGVYEFLDPRTDLIKAEIDGPQLYTRLDGSTYASYNPMHDVVWMNDNMCGRCKRISDGVVCGITDAAWSYGTPTRERP